MINHKKSYHCSTREKEKSVSINSYSTWKSCRTQNSSSLLYCIHSKKPLFGPHLHSRHVKVRKIRMQFRIFERHSLSGDCIPSTILKSLLGSVSSVAQSCTTLCDPMDCSTPAFPVHHQLPELAQTHVHGVGDAIQPSHPPLSPSPAFSLSQHHSNELVLCIRWPKYCSFRISPSVCHHYLIKYFLFIFIVYCLLPSSTV